MKIPLPEFILVPDRPAWLVALQAVLRTLYTLAVFGCCTYLVFIRGESGWLYLLAAALMYFRRGL